MSRERSCVIVVENLPVPFDRRVWQEAQALRQAGWRVSVICPTSPIYPLKFEEIDGIAVYRHALPLEARARFAYLVEYSSALFHQLRLLLKVHKEQGFSVIQACNPPDLIFLVALPFKLVGKRFIFDHHDISPELFVLKFGRKGIFYRLLLTFEWLTFKSADLVISANDTFREIAIGRGGKRPDKVVAVYSIPDRKNIFRTTPNKALRRGRKFVLGYLGVISNQDGVDHMIRAAHHLVRDHGFSDFQAVIIGDGPALPQLRVLARELGVDEHITFTGYLSGEPLLQHLSAFDIGLIPDPVNECNDKLSMNKVFEYTALGIPVVAYRLAETQRLLREVAIYAETPDPQGLADACLQLMRDDALRAERAAKAAELSQESFNWPTEAEKYVAAYERLLGS
jgi:glycosyltransferase involved in cell wall biosynthesis